MSVYGAGKKQIPRCARDDRSETKHSASGQVDVEDCEPILQGLQGEAYED
jgi:hypothetical protein